MAKKNKHNSQKHGFHIVTPSPWPFLSAFSAFLFTFGFVMYLHGYKGGFLIFLLGLISIFYNMFCWWGDVIREATFEGEHTKAVQKGIKIGVLLFILSEAMFFVAFFWAFFHSSFNPSPAIGAVWPPAFLTTIDPWKVPLLNTVILLSSGATVTWAHHAIVSGKKFDATLALASTIALAIYFTGLQAYEYISAPFTIADGIYGSTFYMATGFHGFHVIIGTTFLSVCLYRLYNDHFTQQQHVGFEVAAWYWHFVDIVWIFLFISIYWWGS